MAKGKDLEIQERSGRDSFLKNLKKILFKKKVIKKVIKLDESKVADRELLKERAYLQGQLFNRDKRLNELLEQVKSLQEEVRGGKKEQDIIAKKLREEYVKASSEPFKKAFSLARFFAEFLKDNKFEVFTYDGEKSLGLFDDLILMQDGRIGLSVYQKKNEKGIAQRKVILVGDNLKHIFRDFRGLRMTAERGYLKVNLDTKGNYFEDPLEEEVPKIIMDARGNYSFSKVSKAKLSEMLIDMEKEKQETFQLLSNYENILYENLREIRLKELNSKANRSRAMNSEKAIVDLYNRTNSIIANTNNMIKMFELRGQALGITEDMVKAYDEAMPEFLKKIEATVGKAGVEIVEENMKKQMEWYKYNIAKPVVIYPEKDEKSPMDKEFERGVKQKEFIAKQV